MLLVGLGIVWALDGVLAFEGKAFLAGWLMPKSESTQFQYSLIDFVIATLLILGGLLLLGHLPVPF